MFVYTHHSSAMMEEFLCDRESCLSFTLKNVLEKKKLRKFTSVENGDDSWLQDDENGEKASKVF